MLNVQLVSTAQELEEAITAVGRHPAFAIDSEFDRNRHRYGFNICVVQLAVADTVYIIDPLAISPDRTNVATRLEPLWSLIRSAYHLKIMHACSEDIRLFDKFGAKINRVFDTQVAARMLGIKANGFRDLVEVELGVQLNKKLQTSNWFRRPLDPARIEYLAGDVRYLLELQLRLQQKMEELDRLSWFHEEMEGMLDYEPIMNFDADIAPFVRKREYWDLEPGKRFIARKLWHMRDEIARLRDVPPFYVMADALMYALASRSERLLPGQLPKLGPYMPERKLIAVLNELQDLVRSGQFELVEERKVRPPRPGPDRVSNELALELFAPVVESLVSQLGPDAAQLILSESAIKRIAFAGDVSVLPLYAQRELRRMAERFPQIGRFIPANKAE